MATLLLKRHSKLETRRPNDGRCKKHTKHQQSPGVCSLCLIEKLSQLNNPMTSRRASTTTGTSNGESSTTSSFSSYYSSSDSSTCSSPLHNKASSSSLFFSIGNVGNNVLKKSRSLAFFPRSVRSSNGLRCGDSNGHDVIVNRNEKKKKKSGFWSKFIKPKRSVRESNTKVMQYSRTVRERSSVLETL